MIPGEGKSVWTVEKLGLTELLKLKHTSRQYYVVIPKQIVETYALLPGDLLKVKLVLAYKKSREEEE
ncbi:MAG: hypothetical protein JRE40_01460 [Deltaproteobacteria bacterium]|nr:hypothetical protein [Deltaproteobacteria bacterium]